MQNNVNYLQKGGCQGQLISILVSDCTSRENTGSWHLWW